MGLLGLRTLILILVAINVAGYVGGALFFGRHLPGKLRVLTVAEFFGRRFASHRVQVLAGITVIVGLGAYLVAVTQARARSSRRVAPALWRCASHRVDRLHRLHDLLWFTRRDHHRYRDVSALHDRRLHRTRLHRRRRRRVVRHDRALAVLPLEPASSPGTVRRGNQKAPCGRRMRTESSGP